MITETSILNTRYQLEKKIGQGGFALVYLASDLLLKRSVAIKVLNTELTEDESFLERFSREAQSVAALDHPNILTIYDYGQAEDTAYLVMPYVEGGTVYAKIRREKRLSPMQAGKYLQQVAAALDYAHRRNIVHRDIKPQNMLLRTEDDRLLLTDFGIAKVLSAASSQSRTGVMGTLSYMAPEQLSGNVGKATDIYALGCVLFQMLTGTLPFTGPTEQVVMGHLQGSIPSIVERTGGELGPEIQAIIEKALAKRPEDRYQTAGDLSKAYQTALQALQDTATTVTPLSLGPDEATQVVHTPANYQQYHPTFASSQSDTPPQNPAGAGVPPVVNYQPVPSNLLPAQPSGYQNAGQSGHFTPPQVYPPSNYNAEPVPVAASKNNNALWWIIGLVVVLTIVVVGGIFFIAGNKPGTPTPTSIANVNTATLATNPTVASATATSAATTVPATATPADLPTVTVAATDTSAPPPTTAPTVVPTVANTPVPTAAPPATVPAANVDAIKSAFASLPGTTSSVVLLPNGQNPVVDDPDRQCPAGSVIDLWIAAAAYDQSNAGKLNLSEKYQIKPNDIAPGTGILQSKVGTGLTIQELIDTMLIYSDNSAANIVANRLGGMNQVNQYIANNGYKNTRLQRRMGVPDPNHENLTSGHDTTLFLQTLLNHQVVDANRSDAILQALQKRATNPQDQNYFGGNLPPDVDYVHISGTGTGVRDEVGYITLDPNSHTVVIIALFINQADEKTAENALATAIGQIYQATKP